MAVGGHHQEGPYGAVIVVMTWAIQNRSFVEGRLRLSGADPDKMLFSHVLDVAYTLLVELFQSSGQTLFEAIETVEGLGLESEPTPKLPTPQDEAANMALLSGALAGSDFKGAFV